MTEKACAAGFNITSNPKRFSINPKSCFVYVSLLPKYPICPFNTYTRCPFKQLDMEFASALRPKTESLDPIFTKIVLSFVKGLGGRLQGSGFRVRGPGFRLESSRFTILGSDLGFQIVD